MLVSPIISEEKINLAQEMLKSFVEQFSSFYGQTSVTHNVHSLLHLGDTAKEFGTLSDITAYPFENAMKTLKRAIRKPQFVEEQLFNVFENMPILKTNKSNGVKKYANGKIKSFTSELGYFSTNFSDSYCLLTGNLPEKIIRFNNNGTFEAKSFLT